MEAMANPNAIDASSSRRPLTVKVLTGTGDIRSAKLLANPSARPTYTSEGLLASLDRNRSGETIHLLPFAGRLITLTIGLRFLTDHLAGDVYFRTHRPNHNLDRCRAQLALLASLEAQDDAFREIVKGVG